MREHSPSPPPIPFPHSQFTSPAYNAQPWLDPTLPPQIPRWRGGSVEPFRRKVKRRNERLFTQPPEPARRQPHHSSLPPSAQTGAKKAHPVSVGWDPTKPSGSEKKLKRSGDSVLEVAEGRNGGSAQPVSPRSAVGSPPNPSRKRRHREADAAGTGERHFLGRRRHPPKLMRGPFQPRCWGPRQSTHAQSNATQQTDFEPIARSATLLSSKRARSQPLKPPPPAEVLKKPSLSKPSKLPAASHLSRPPETPAPLQPQPPKPSRKRRSPSHPLTASSPKAVPPHFFIGRTDSPPYVFGVHTITTIRSNILWFSKGVVDEEQYLSEVGVKTSVKSTNKYWK